MKRGDVVTIALRGDLGKPRPAVVVETDRLKPSTHILVCPGTSFVRPEIELRRVLVLPDDSNKLRTPTHFQIDRLIGVRRENCGSVIGQLDEDALAQINAGLMTILGLAE